MHTPLTWARSCRDMTRREYLHYMLTERPFWNNLYMELISMVFYYTPLPNALANRTELFIERHDRTMH